MSTMNWKRKRQFHGGSIVPVMCAALVPLASVLACPIAHASQQDIADELIEADQQQATESSVVRYHISAFTLRYLIDHPDHIPLEQVLAVEVELVRTDDGYAVAADEGQASVTRSIAQLNEEPASWFTAGAVQRVIERIRDLFVDAQYLGVFVAPDPMVIDETGRDNRGGDRTDFPLIIATGIVSEMRSLASGDRIDPEQRVDNPLHASLLERSPIRPWDSASDAPREDLLKKDVLDDYVFFKSRHPGRRLDVALAAAQMPGTVALDYQITENNPLVLYAQMANTGTSSTGYWRQRFGLFHTQLTNNDDIFSAEFTTNGFDGTHSALGSYEAPFGSNDRLRWQASIAWSQFTADEVGFLNENFTGRSWTGSGKLFWNLYQDRELFVDLVAGLTFLDLRVDNPGVGRGEEQFLLPELGARLERTTEWFSSEAELMFQYGSLTDLDPAELARLGRTAPDDEWVKLVFAGRHSFYLEPLLDRAGWEDPTTPETSTLAHELMFRGSGQFTFDDKRLVPQLTMVAGGLYTVRGYPESVASGDSVIIGSAEYRFHLPRVFGVEAEPRQLFGMPFRSAPQFVYGQPDWDLVLKGFLDAAHVTQNDIQAFESDATLVGAGVGVEFLYRRNVNVRVDWGFALHGLEDRGVASGANRVHFVATFLF